MKITWICFFFSMIFLFTTCKDEEEIYLTLSVNEFAFMAEGEQGEVSIITNQEWYISSATDWLTFVPTSGSGNSSFIVTALANPEDHDRSVSFYVHAGKLTDTVAVSQRGTYLTLDRYEILFDREGTPQEISLFTTYDWEIIIHEEAEWCRIDILQGTGDHILTLTPEPYLERVPRRDDQIEFICNNSSYFLKVSQEIDNIAPVAPELITPEDTQQIDGIYPYFSWTESWDEDSDEVYYNIFISKDRDLEPEGWEDISGRITQTEYAVNRKYLEENTDYYWRILVSDDFGGETYSEIYHFRTGTNQIYDNHSLLVVQKAPLVFEQNPNLVILGDGFVREDFGKGNIYDVMADIAIEAFFGFEPLKTYKDYFNVYKIVTYSEESGATVSADFAEQDVQAQTKNTAFKSNLVGKNSTDIDCDTDLVFEYVMESLELTEEELDNTTIILVINLDVYAGTTVMTPTGRSISMCPIGRDTFKEVVGHEAGGHGFGRLLDEYIYYPTLTIPQERIDVIELFRDGDPWSFAANLSLTGQSQQVHWIHYLSQQEYQVGFYQGGYLYGKGIWRPEEYSCMQDNIPYFNAPSREAIVRRIMRITAQEFDWDEFYEKDEPKVYVPDPVLLMKNSIRKLSAPLLMY
ncbi:MAG: M64 family metallo-endopeptidase, partial [Tannerellaceae bacterium]|nr:M64 family metallo-endopeptidase [Tannerellaceae bacterium]